MNLIQETMAISANTLFRFVTDIKWLKKVLEDCAFEPRYSIEYDKEQEDGSYYAIPMVCFCDITLTEIKEHVKDYGCYGIGLAKQWAKNNVSPVIYFNNKSSLVKTIYDKLNDKLNETTLDSQSTFLFCLLKKYYGYTWSSAIGNKKQKILYNEREWRFVPRKISPKILRIKVNKAKDFVNENEKIKDKSLKFTYKDVKYIIIGKEDERLNMIKFLKKTIQDNVTCDMLSSKILTLKQIKEDF